MVCESEASKEETMVQNGVEAPKWKEKMLHINLTYK
jgi:hypothetical protein